MPDGEGIIRRSSTLSRVLRNKNFFMGSIILLMYLVMAVIGPYIVTNDPLKQNLEARLSGPSFEHPFGKDELGRDMLSRIVYGAKLSLGMAFSAATMAAASGTLVGLISGYFGGRLDAILMRFIDLMLAFPTILLGLAIMTVFGRGLGRLALALGIAGVPSYARLVRSTVLSLRQEEFVFAAASIGASDFRIMFWHILPNTISPLTVQLTYGTALTLILGAGLSFLGLGAQPPDPEWGVMLSRSREYVRIAPHLMVIPGLAITIVTLGLNLVGDGLRDALDPRLGR